MVGLHLNRSNSKSILKKKKLPVERFQCADVLAAAVFLLLTACTHNTKTAPSLFEQLDSTQTHIGFVNNLSDTGALNILDYLYYYNGAGVAAGDVNNDGLTDLFFVSNEGKNKLYLNRSTPDKRFVFEDVSARAGIEGFADWQTGVTMADVNGDGWLDIYVCAVADFKGLKGSNELYINNGTGGDGNVTFIEGAADYKVNAKGFSTQAAFFDYDKDGDLDMYLLNHAVHTSRSYGKASTRVIPDVHAGDYLFENLLVSKDSKESVAEFKDVTRQAGIYQAAMGYGLGLAIADFNNDGWDDIYVSNDFHEDDYYYVNNGNGTFSESGKEYFPHMSRFSMGCDAADINNDGFPDLMTLDMYPENETIYKSSTGEDPFDIYLFKLQYGYHFQYSRNCLQLNRSGKGFADVGVMAGVSATDWSWSPLIADYNNDGYKDIFISNGIVHRPNDLDFIKYISNNQQYSAPDRSLDQKAIALMPEGKVHNYIFKGTEQVRYEDKSLDWGFSKQSISNGAAYADLDNDGDLDLVTNNINEPSGIYENHTNTALHNHYLRCKLEGVAPNVFGIGSKVILKHQGMIQVQQLMPTKGFQSSVEPLLTFGLGNLPTLDTLIVIWENGVSEIKTNVKTNTLLTLDERNGVRNDKINEITFPKSNSTIIDVSDSFSIPYRHNENVFYDFYKEPLMPFEVSTEGPKIAVGDVNADGLQDFYVGGAKGQPGELFLQQADGKFLPADEHAFSADSLHEDVDAVFFDADSDGDLDLYVVSGGNEFYGSVSQLLDRLYFNDGSGKFARRKDSLPLMYDNKSCVVPCDIDNDGDVDLFVGGRVIAGQYGQSPNSYLLYNNGKGEYSDLTDTVSPQLRKAGMVTDAHWFDWDNDGDQDLIVVGDWMPIRIFENKDRKLVEVLSIKGLEQSNGFWQTIEASDFDHDGDTDFIVGNLGLNTKLRKDNDSNLQIFIKDIDNNGSLEHIVAHQIDGQLYPMASTDELHKQLPMLRKKFNNYKDFAGKTLEQLFDQGELQNAKVLTVNRFESIYLENRGGQFRQHLLPEEAQVSKIFTFLVDDVDLDGKDDILMGGNFFGVSMYQGRYDASYGLILKGDDKGNFNVLNNNKSFSLKGEVRDIKNVETSQGHLFLVARNNLPFQFFKKNSRDH